MDERTGFHRHRWRTWPTPAQRRILDLLVVGGTNAWIAERLSLSSETVKWHIAEMLAETGLENRQALASWWMERRDEPGLSVFPLPLRLPVFLGAGVLTTIAILIGVVLVVRGAKEALVHESEPEVTRNDGFLEGRFPPSPALFSDFYIEVETQILGNQDGRSQVALRDLHGHLLASVDAGYAPMVLVRRSTNELLVSSMVNIERVNRQEEPPDMQLQSFSLDGYSMTMTSSIELPDREVCTTYCQPMTLSADERYLYYGSRRTAPECGAGGDASVCDVHAIIGVDLMAGDYVRTELPRGCGIPALGKAGLSGAIVACRGQYPAPGGYGALIDGGGGLREIAFGGSVQFLSASDEGDVLAVRRDGRIIELARDGTRREGNALPAGLAAYEVNFQGAADLGDGRLFLTLWSSDGLDFAVLDLTTLQVEGRGEFPATTSYLPQGDRLLMLRDGRVDVLDLRTGAIITLARGLGEGVEVLLPGR